MKHRLWWHCLARHLPCLYGRHWCPTTHRRRSSPPEPTLPVVTFVVAPPSAPAAPAPSWSSSTPALVMSAPLSSSPVSTPPAQAPPMLTPQSASPAPYPLCRLLWNQVWERCWVHSYRWTIEVVKVWLLSSKNHTLSVGMKIGGARDRTRDKRLRTHTGRTPTGGGVQNGPSWAGPPSHRDLMRTPPLSIPCRPQRPPNSEKPTES
jgi:hypothetical protein